VQKPSETVGQTFGRPIWAANQDGNMRWGAMKTVRLEAWTTLPRLLPRRNEEWAWHDLAPFVPFWHRLFGVRQGDGRATESSHRLDATTKPLQL